MIACAQPIQTEHYRMDPASPPPAGPEFPPTDVKVLGYMFAALTLGALSALAALLGSDRVLTWRVAFAYVISGALASLGVVLLAVERLGFSYFLVGLSIFAGYKAVDVLAAISLSVTKLGPFLLSRLLGSAPSPTSEKPRNPQDSDVK